MNTRTCWILAALVLGALVPITAATNTTATVENTPATVKSGGLAPSEDEDPSRPGIQVYPIAGGTRKVVVRVEAYDPNGAADIDDVEARLMKPGNTSVHKDWSDLSKKSATATTAIFEKEFDMKHYDATGVYTIEMLVESEDGTKRRAWATFEYGGAVALGLSAGDVNFGVIKPGVSEYSPAKSLVITNNGNTRIDLEYSGTALTGPSGGAIPVSNVRIAGTADMLDASALAGTKAVMASFDLDPEATKTVWFDLLAPAGTPAGSYSGQMTLSAVSDR